MRRFFDMAVALLLVVALPTPSSPESDGDDARDALGARIAEAFAQTPSASEAAAPGLNGEPTIRDTHTLNTIMEHIWDGDDASITRMVGVERPDVRWTGYEGPQQSQATWDEASVAAGDAPRLALSRVNEMGPSRWEEMPPVAQSLGALQPSVV